MTDTKRPNDLAARRGYSYRMSRRSFLVTASAAALAAACAPAVTGGASEAVII